MIRVILVDDEKRALEALHDILNQFDQIEVVALFTNPLEAISYCEGAEVDAVFLDIEMPGIKGIEAADRLQEICSAEIVFVTAYDHYAVEAFERYAVDYLLKPVIKRRAMKTVERLIMRKNVLEQSNHHNMDRKLCKIRCFGRFEVMVQKGQEPSVNFKWRFSKAKELFAFLVQHRGKVVHKGTIAECLWPEMDTDKAIPYLHSCIYQIRKQIKGNQLEDSIKIRLIDDGYQLHLHSVVECDIDDFIQLTSDLSGTTQDVLRNLEQALEIYSGNYMEYEDYHWALDEQLNYQRMEQEILVKMASYYEDEGKIGKSIVVLQRLIASNPYHERYHELLMEAYARLGDWESFVMHYKQAQMLYVEDLGVELPASLQIIYQNWRNEK